MVNNIQKMIDPKTHAQFFRVEVDISLEAWFDYLGDDNKPPIQVALSEEIFTHINQYVRLIWLDWSPVAEAVMFEPICTDTLNRTEQLVREYIAEMVPHVVVENINIIVQRDNHLRVVIATKSHGTVAVII